MIRLYKQPFKRTQNLKYPRTKLWQKCQNFLIERNLGRKCANGTCQKSWNVFLYDINNHSHKIIIDNLMRQKNKHWDILKFGVFLELLSIIEKYFKKIKYSLNKVKYIFISFFSFFSKFYFDIIVFFVCVLGGVFQGYRKKMQNPFRQIFQYM